ncbi:unnamed protein product [Camellia sinensis]
MESDMDEKQSFEALKQQEPEKKTIPDEEQGGGEDEDEEFDEVDDDDDDGGAEGEVGGEQRKQLSELPPIETRYGASQSETLASASSENDLPSDFHTSSHLLSVKENDLTEVPVDYALLRPLVSTEFKDQIGVSQQQALVSVTTEAAQTKSHNQLQSPGCLTSSPELSPTSVTQSISSAPSPTHLDKKLSPVVNTNSARMPHVEKHDSANPKPISSVRVVKTPSTDGYNWRKYGQKQVRSPQGSRSYYKCTFCDCLAKKIEFCDHSNRVIEIISKGQHNHDPTWGINCTRESRLALPAAPNSTAHPVRMLNDSDPSTSSRELIQETPVLPETKHQDSIGSDGSTEIDIKEEHVDEPEPKRRLKKSNSSYSGSSFKPGKKPKFIVHAAGDVGISGDGYRWRKYGQKMVKGNPHPSVQPMSLTNDMQPEYQLSATKSDEYSRPTLDIILNYYRCTSAGCPVRKHIERAVDNTTAVIITYKGIHDHDMPVPKKRHGPPSAPLVAAAAPASMNLQFKKTEAIANQISATQWSVDTEGELTSETLDTGEEKAMESARTLLSIGFEIKQC